MLTRNDAAMKEIHRRAVHLERDSDDETTGWNPVIDTMRWATASLCGQREDFKAAFEKAAEMCEVCKANGGKTDVNKNEKD